MRFTSMCCGFGSLVRTSGCPLKSAQVRWGGGRTGPRLAHGWLARTWAGPQNSRVKGQASIQTITLDRYGHLMPGNEEQAASLLDRYLVASENHA